MESNFGPSENEWIKFCDKKPQKGTKIKCKLNANSIISENIIVINLEYLMNKFNLWKYTNPDTPRTQKIRKPQNTLLF